MTDNAAYGAAEWWICSDFFVHDGKKVLGPFVSRDLALTVRQLLELARRPTTFAVDSLPPNDGSAP